MSDIGEEGTLVAEANTVSLLSNAEINQQIATAKRYPRSVSSFIKKATELVTLNEAIAQQCIYALPRDNKVIEGPSARMAEVIINAWGNSRAGARIAGHRDSDIAPMFRGAPPNCSLPDTWASYL